MVAYAEKDYTKNEYTFPYRTGLCKLESPNLMTIELGS